MKIQSLLGNDKRSKQPSPEVRNRQSQPKSKISWKTKWRRKSKPYLVEPGADNTVVAAAADSTEGATSASEYFESDDTGVEKKWQNRNVTGLVDMKKQATKFDQSRRKHKEELLEELNNIGGQLCESTVFDLDERSKLPAKIIDLITCRRDEYCIHDHDRCRIVNNKLYIQTKPSCGNETKQFRTGSPLKVSEQREIQTYPKHGKRVTFSPVHRPRTPNLSPPLLSVSSATESIVLDNAMPPPPRGYHVRIDPSSFDSTSACDEEVSPWSHTYQDFLKDVEKTKFSKTGMADSQMQIKYNKRDFKKSSRASPLRSARYTKKQLKKLGLKSVVEGTGDVQMGNGAFGDYVYGDTTKEPCNQENMDMYCGFKDGNDTKPVVCNIQQLSPKTARKKAKADKLRAHSINKTRHRLTQRALKNDNNNNMNTFHNNVMLNSNTNANSGSESVQLDEKNIKVDINAGSVPLSAEQTSAVPACPMGGETDAENDTQVNQEQILSGNAGELINTIEKSLEVHHQADQGGDIIEKPSLTDNEPEGWEAKRHTIMQACNQAIKNRMQRQEIEEDESLNLTTSDSLASRQNSEARKRRKVKTTDSVYVKFKASLSKKTTTTTTVKEVKQTSSASNPKSLMLENDHQNALGTTSQGSDQSLTAPQPRHTRIVKCGDLEVPLRKRKLYSDTEVELLHESDINKPPLGTFKNDKDQIANDKQSSKIETSLGDASSTVEDQFKVPDNTGLENDVQQSPQQKASNCKEEIVGECDKISEKGSAVTVIYIKEPQKIAKKKEKMPITLTTDGSQQAEKNEVQISESGQTNSPAIEDTQAKEKSKRRFKSNSKQTSSKKKSDSKINTLNQFEPTDSLMGTSSNVEHPQSDTSLSHKHLKEAQENSESKLDRFSRRCHSSPPDGRKKKNKEKKKGSMTITVPSESLSKRIHKGRKRSPDRKKKPKTSKADRLRKTGSMSSAASSEKKRKSHTTASSISIDSSNSEAVELSPPPGEKHERQKIKQDDTFVTPMAVPETCPNETAEPGKQSEGIEKESSSQLAIKEAESKTSNGGVKEITTLVKNAPDACHKPIHKGFVKNAGKNQPIGKDLQKAEVGWNSSVYKTGTAITKPSASVLPKKSPFRRTKVKYFLVKAKDKQIKKDSEKPTKQKSKEKVVTKNTLETASEQVIKSDSQDLSLKGQGKTVQFSESIEKIETIKRLEGNEEGHPVDEHPRENHIDGTASDGSLGDAFLTANFDLVREMIEEEDEEEELDRKPEQDQVKQENIEAPDHEKNASPPKKYRRPIWLKKAQNKSSEDARPAVVTSSTNKTCPSPQFGTKRDNSMDEMLQSKRCNIQVTNPLPPTGASIKEYQVTPKPRVAYSTMLRNIFEALPLKRPVKLLIAQIGSPVDIKEVTEGSSVDAADYAKALRYAATHSKRSVAAVLPGTGATAKRKKIAVDNRIPVLPNRTTKTSLGDGGSFRSMVSVDSETLDRRLLTPNCSFSTDLDEAAVQKQRSTHSAPSSRGLKVFHRKKDQGRPRPGTVMMKGGPSWQYIGKPRNPERDGVHQISELEDMHVGGDMDTANYLNQSLTWVMQEFFNRFNFLNPAQSGRSVYRNISPEHSIDPAHVEETFGAV